MKYLFASLFVLAPLALAAPYPHSSVDVVLLESRQDCSVTCGNNCYSSDQIQDALSTGYDDYSNGQEVHSYPHQYNDYEGFSFPVSGPYQEFPIMTSGAYTGGSPGADRIIFNEDGDFAGLITHTGASGDDFVGCSDT